MISLKDNDHGVTLIGVIVTLIIIFIAIMVGLRFKGHIQKENIANKVEFNFYKNINNIVEEAYSFDWEYDSERLKELPKEFEVLENNLAKVTYSDIISEREPDSVNVLKITFEYKDKVNPKRSIEPKEYRLEQAKINGN